MQWEAKFVGREKGAIGIMSRHSLRFTADTLRDAEREFWDNVYKTHQDIIALVLVPVVDSGQPH